MIRTYQPKKRQRKKEHGFRKRMKTADGRNVLKTRKGQSKTHLLTVDDEAATDELWPPFSLLCKSTF